MADKMFRTWGPLVLWGPFTPVDDLDLDRVEREIGCELPAPYRAFLRTANGGQLPYAVSLPPGADGTLISFDTLTPLDRLAESWRTHAATAEAAELPPGLLPVAADGGGSQLYLDLRPAAHGQVWAFVHGLPEWAGGSGTDAAGVVAADWDAYLELLVLDEETAEFTWEDTYGLGSSAEERPWVEAVTAWLDAGLSDWRDREWARQDTQR